MKHNLFISLLLSITLNSFAQSDIKQVGVDESKFFPHAQEKTNWCWAASIQMVLEYYNMYVSQNDIVNRTFGQAYNGEIPNLGGSVQVISDNLNKWELDLINQPKEVKSVFYYHPPTANELVSFLKNKQPIYLSYKSGLSTNHAIVITGCRYIETGPDIQILDITARDPWPSKENVRSDGLVKYDYSNFYKLMNYFWIVSVRLKGMNFSSTKSINDCSLPFCLSLRKALSGFDNNFTELRGSQFGTKLFRSNIKFPNEQSDYFSIGERPTYYVRFYKGANYDSSRIAFEDLKANFDFLNIELEETTRLPFNNAIRGSKNKTVNIQLEKNRIIRLKWNYLDESDSYVVSMTLNMKDFLDE